MDCHGKVVEKAALQRRMKCSLSRGTREQEHGGFADGRWLLVVWELCEGGGDGWSNSAESGDCSP